MKRFCLAAFLLYLVSLAAGCAWQPTTAAGPRAGGSEPTGPRLYLVRHGNAQPADVDPERSLTATGAADVKKVARFLQPLRLRVDAVWHSGLARARETAELLAPGFTPRPTVIEQPGLKPRDPPGPILHGLTAAKKSVVIVGHRPWLAAAASTLLADGQRSSPVEVQEAAVICLELGDDGAWRLRWMITPRLLP